MLHHNEELLRALEYFDGTLFLTTNRAGSIDPAFHSRITLALSYPRLSAANQRQLWLDWILKAQNGNGSGGDAKTGSSNVISKSCDDSSSIDDKKNTNRPPWLTDVFLDELVATASVNGREVKNVVRMAQALARSEDRAMRTEDVLLGLQALQTFEAEFAVRNVEEKAEGKPGDEQLPVSLRNG